MKNTLLFAAALLALPLAATAQTKTTSPTKTPAATAKPATEQVTEVIEELDPNTGKVIRRTTRTTTVPIGTTPAGRAASPAATGSSPSSASPDTLVSDFFRERMAVSRLTAPQLVDTYTRFLDKVRNDRRTWVAADWERAATVLSSLNGRYEQLRDTFSFDDKLTIRGTQAEFQALRTARQLSGQISDKL